MVVQNGFENVDLLLIKDSRINLVEQIHTDEGVIQDGVKSKTISRLHCFLIPNWFEYQIKRFREENIVAEVHKNHHY